MITVDIKGGRVRIRGHAGSAPRGEDLVCAAVSSLAYALAVNLEEINPLGLEIHMEPGNVDISSQYNVLARIAIKFTANGLKALAEQYPDYIQIL